MDDNDVIRLVVDDPAPELAPAPPPAPVSEPELPALPEDASTVDRVEHLLLKTMQVLEQSSRWKDGRLALQAIKEARACLELTARLQGELAQAAQVNVGVQVNGQGEGDFDAQVNELIAAITAHASPACARCGESCSACLSEALPMASLEALHRSKAALARDRAPGGPESDVDDAVVIEDALAVEEPADVPAGPGGPRWRAVVHPKALPAPASPGGPTGRSSWAPPDPGGW